MKKPWPEGILEPLYKAIGSLVFNWSYVETSLDFSIAIIFRSAGGKHVENEIPRMLSRKTSFLKKCLKRIDALEPFKQEGLDLLSRVNGLSETRHFIVHGYFSDYRDDGKHSLLFIKIDAEKSIHVGQERWFTAKDIVDSGNAAVKLASDLIRFNKRLADRFIPEDKIDQPFGGI